MSKTIATIIVVAVMSGIAAALWASMYLHLKKIYPVTVKIKFADRIRKGKNRKGGLKRLDVSTQMAKEIYEDYKSGGDKIKFHLKMREYEQDLYPATGRIPEIESIQFFKGKQEIDFAAEQTPAAAPAGPLLNDSLNKAGETLKPHQFFNYPLDRWQP